MWIFERESTGAIFQRETFYNRIVDCGTDAGTAVVMFLKKWEKSAGVFFRSPSIPAPSTPASLVQQEPSITESFEQKVADVVVAGFDPDGLHHSGQKKWPRPGVIPI